MKADSGDAGLSGLVDAGAVAPPPAPTSDFSNADNSQYFLFWFSGI